MPPIISEHTQIQPQSHPTEIRACVQQSPSPPLCLLGLKMCFCGCPTLPKTLRQGWTRPAGWRNLHRGAVLGQKRLSPDSAPSENSHFSFLTKMAKNGDLTVNDLGMESSKWYSPGDVGQIDPCPRGHLISPGKWLWDVFVGTNMARASQALPAQDLLNWFC